MAKFEPKPNRPGTRQARLEAVLQRAQEVQEVLLLAGTKVVKVLLDLVGFAAIGFMGGNGRTQVCGTAIVQQENSLPEAPQGSRAELVSASRTLTNVIRQARTHMVELDIGKRRDGLVAQPSREV